MGWGSFDVAKSEVYTKCLSSPLEGLILGGRGVIWCNQICKSECPAWDRLMEGGIIWWIQIWSNTKYFKFSMRRSNSGRWVTWCSQIWSPHKMSSCPAWEGPILVCACVWKSWRGVIRCSQIWSPHEKVRLWGYGGIWCSQNWSPRKMSKLSQSEGLIVGWGGGEGDLM